MGVGAGEVYELLTSRFGKLPVAQPGTEHLCIILRPRTKEMILMSRSRMDFQFSSEVGRKGRP